MKRLVRGASLFSRILSYHGCILSPGDEMSGKKNIKNLFFDTVNVSACLPSGSHSVEIQLINFYIAGYQFYTGPQIENKLAPDTELKLIRNPENRHDPGAIRILHRDVHIGYVPKRNNEILAKLLDGGAELTSRIIKINPDEPTWHRVKVEVYLVYQKQKNAPQPAVLAG